MILLHKNFYEKSSKIIWQIGEKGLTLHSLFGNGAAEAVVMVK
ncbi:MAG: hypothetical protein ACI306_04925 [Muribaculaceae bacterium]